MHAAETADDTDMGFALMNFHLCTSCTYGTKYIYSIFGQYVCNI